MLLKTACRPTYVAAWVASACFALVIGGCTSAVAPAADSLSVLIVKGLVTGAEQAGVGQTSVVVAAFRDRCFNEPIAVDSSVTDLGGNYRTVLKSRGDGIPVCVTIRVVTRPPRFPIEIGLLTMRQRPESISVVVPLGGGGT